MEQHVEEQCPMTEVACTYSEAGCIFKVRKVVQCKKHETRIVPQITLYLQMNLPSVAD